MRTIETSFGLRHVGMPRHACARLRLQVKLAAYRRLDALSVGVFPDTSTMASAQASTSKPGTRVACPPSDFAMDGDIAGEDGPTGGERLEQWQVEAFVARRSAGCRCASHRGSKISVGEVATEHDVRAIRRRAGPAISPASGSDQHELGTSDSRPAPCRGRRAGCEGSCGAPGSPRRAGSAAAAPSAADPRYSAAALPTTPDPRRDARPPHDRRLSRNSSITSSRTASLTTTTHSLRVTAFGTSRR